MKRIILILLLLSCSKVIKDTNFKNKDINEDLALAIINNDTDEAIELINKGANVNYIYNNKTILELIMDFENLEIIEVLLKKGVELNKDSVIKIYDISLEGFDYDIVDIIKDKYKIEEGEIDNNKYFLLLCYISNAKEVRKFIEKHNIKPKKIKDKTDKNGLIISAAGNKIDVFKMLIEEYKFNINYENNSGVTSLTSSSFRNNIEIIKILLEKGANVYHKDSKEWTSLMLASQNGHKEIVEILLEKGANVNDKNIYGWTSLMLASEKGHKEIVKLLLEKGANVNFKTNNECTALMIASMYGRIEVAEILLEKGAEVNCRSNNGWTALMIASMYGHTEVVELFLKKGVNVNYKDNDGWTALRHAFKKLHIEIVELLIKKGINIYEKDKSDQTVLIHISEYLRSANEKSDKDKLIDIAYIIIRKIAEDYIHLFISLNKNNTSQEIKDEVHNYISLLYSLQKLPTELFEEVIRKF